MLLARSTWADLYLLHMPEGSVIRPHTDPVVEGMAHHRLNVIIKAPRIGGMFTSKGPKRTWIAGRVVCFRPDLVEHEVTKVEKGSRWVLSFGWLTTA